MNVFFGFLVSATVAMLLAVAIVLYSRKALYELLVELCGNGARAHYWASFAGLFLSLSTLYGVLVSWPGTDARLSTDFPALSAGLSSFRAGVLGLLLALGCIAIVMFLGIHRHENRMAQARRRNHPQDLAAD
jgi:hypothetical protein